ncbi:LacI family DNA-binding transcriptional regulator [Pseudoclavibacter terrae]|uniref:LacI family DNA-binding transcriptional regulator n=1 Tax=Pseudoclavibacter terrae TaxID=1530195 RepID=UPI00232A9BEE|nr:LacI family DNA-binding transcriptional regulator [Pseudoclavibacter terrae]
MSESSGAPQKAAGRVTLVDVARHAGVSTAAASKVIRNAAGVSEDMRARVSASIAELSYRPRKSARALRGSTYSVGLVLGDIENPFNALLLEGARSVLDLEGYDVLISPAGVDAAKQQHMADLLMDHDVDGLILVSPRFSEEQLEALASTIPIVVIGRHGPGLNYDTVAGDDARGSELVVDHLVRLGHETIAFVSNLRSDDPPTLPDVLRRRGFEASMTIRDLERSMRIIEAAWSVQGGHDAGSQLLTDTGVTAVHAGSDVVALGLNSTLHSAGFAVPEHLSLVGHDNSPVASLAPFSLTSVDQQGHLMGQHASKMLLERIAGRRAPQDILLEPTLRVRGSTGQARAR